MPVEIFTNDGTGTVTAGGTNAPAAGTVQTWTVSATIAFPAASNSATPPTQFYVADPAAETEKILVTNVSGGTWTVTRGADGTTPVLHAANFQIVQVVARASLQALQLPAFRTFWYAPSGDATGAADTAAINGAYTAGFQAVQLMAGTYYVNNTITVPSGCALTGAFPVMADNISNYGGGTLQPQGTVITAAGAFTGGGGWPVAVIQCTNSTATQQGGQYLGNFSIQANTTPSGSGVFGILLDGAVAAGFIDNVIINRPDGACLRTRTDGTSGLQPDQWRFSRCVFAASRSSHGVQIQNLPDSVFDNCLAHDNALDGWNIGSSTNGKFTDCRAETNTGNGFHMTGFVTAGSYLIMNGCSALLNKNSGYLFDATGFTAQGRYELRGCVSAQDGQLNSGILAGFYDNGCKSSVTGIGCTVITNGTGPAYGAYEGSVAFAMTMIGCFLPGNTAATHDDGTNTHALATSSSVAF